MEKFKGSKKILKTISFTFMCDKKQKQKKKRYGQKYLNWTKYKHFCHTVR